MPASASLNEKRLRKQNGSSSSPSSQAARSGQASPVAGRPRRDIRFRILIPVWGEKYIDNLCAIALPALLANGNLPTLVAYAECEVIFLTASSSRPYFDSHPGIQALGRVCPYSFELIDDLLLLDRYGFILTIAYGRGIRSMGRRQRSTYFLFLNADFVFSDGLLRTVVDRIDQGFHAVMAPSLRCNEEDVSPILLRQVSRANQLSAKPAELLRTTLDNMHPTAAVSIMNEANDYAAMHNAAAHQFFWRVDDDTLIGRFFLMFMLCIRPEVAYVAPTGWCDYAFVPDLVPSGKIDVLTDSDDGFILEMQARQGDSGFLSATRLPPEGYAPRLSVWTTVGHRATASRNVVFHTGPVPRQAESVNAEIDAFMARLVGALEPAVSHREHPFWTGTIAAMRVRLPTVACVELGWIPSRTDRLLGRLGTFTQGRAPHVTRLHRAFLDYANFSREISRIGASAKAVLHIAASPSPVDSLIENFSDRTGVDLKGLTELRALTPRFDAAVIVIPAFALYRLGQILRQAAPHCRDDAPILVCVDAVDDAFLFPRVTAFGGLLEMVAKHLSTWIVVESLRTIAAPERFVPAFRMRTARDLLASPSPSTWLAAAIIGSAAAARLLATNLWHQEKGAERAGDVSGSMVVNCTSATMQLRAPWRTIAEAQAEAATQFDVPFYELVNSDVTQAGVDPRTHFDSYGWREGRDPSAVFSTSGYLQANPDVKDAWVNPLDHFCRYGRAEGRNGWQI